jgi:hypothetical protein
MPEVLKQWLEKLSKSDARDVYEYLCEDDPVNIVTDIQDALLALKD